MISVDFFILPDDSLASLQRYVCKLAEAHWQENRRTLIQTDDLTQSQSLDDLLWAFKINSFIPHAVATLESVDHQQPILISHQKISNESFESIINISSRPANIPNKTSKRNTLIIKEILNQQEERKISGRQNYKFYRDSGYTLNHHTLETIDG